MSKKFLSFVFPETIKKQIDSMPAELKLSFYEAVTNYGMYGTEPEFEGFENIVWISMKDLLDSCMRQSGAPEGNQNAKKTIKSIENNSKQLKQSKNNQINQNNPETIETTLNNGNGNVNGNDKDNGKCNSVPEGTQVGETPDTPPSPPKESRRFIKPTVEEVAEYCRERHNSVDPNRFHNFYESKGWKVGKEPMKDWRAAVRNWEKPRTEQTGGRTLWGNESNVPEDYYEIM